MYLWILITGAFSSFYNSWGIGANDCANSFATSVGAKVLTLKQAIAIAGVFEFLGAFLMGSHVTSAIRKKIVSLDVYEDNPGVLMIGMLCANLAAGIWLHLASFLKLPVSTTHSTIGAIIGFSLAYGGKDAIKWSGVSKIVASWFISPILAGVFSLLFYTAAKKFVFEKENPAEKTLYIFPLLTFFTFLINTFFIFYKGTPQLELDDLPVWISVVTSLIISSITSFISGYFYVPYARKRLEKRREENRNQIEIEKIDSNELERTKSYNEAVIVEKIYDDDLNLDENIEKLKNYSNRLKNRKKSEKLEILHKNAIMIDEDAEYLCSSLQVITACFSSFAHGSNDVANSIAPFATIYAIYSTEEVAKKSEVPLWILFMGGAGIVLGLATWGYKIIERIGQELTKITASRGFIIELSAALTTLIASRAELPVSTTHCQIGSVVGCGISDNKNNMEWKLIRQIILSWLVTLPITGFISAGLFSFAIYSPC